MSARWTKSCTAAVAKRRREVLRAGADLRVHQKAGQEVVAVADAREAGDEVLRERVALLLAQPIAQRLGDARPGLLGCTWPGPRP
jgi:hypothetical protein